MMLPMPQDLDQIAEIVLYENLTDAPTDPLDRAYYAAATFYTDLTYSGIRLRLARRAFTNAVRTGRYDAALSAARTDA